MTPAMLSADYWIARQPNPDQRILSPEEIETKSLPAPPGFLSRICSLRKPAGGSAAQNPGFFTIPPENRRRTRRIPGRMKTAFPASWSTSRYGSWKPQPTASGFGSAPVSEADGYSAALSPYAAAAGNGWMPQDPEAFSSLSPPDGSPCCRSGRRRKKNRPPTVWEPVCG